MSSLVQIGRSGLNGYACLMSLKPFTTNFVTGACLAGLGDVLCQKIALRMAGGGKLFDERNWDARRTLNISLIRACLIAPFIMFWYARLGQIFPGHDMAQRIQRVLLNEAVGGPVMITLVFVGNAILRGEWSLSGLSQRFRDEFFPTLKKGVTYWPLVHLLGTFRLPVKHQPLFAHVASVYWNGVLSFHANKPKDH